jgi:hypothetical protein
MDYYFSRMNARPRLDAKEAPEGYVAVEKETVRQYPTTPNWCSLCEYRKTCQTAVVLPPCRTDTRKDGCSVVFKRLV